jgi:hypothetical protein
MPRQQALPVHANPTALPDVRKAVGDRNQRTILPSGSSAKYLKMLTTTIANRFELTKPFADFMPEAYWLWRIKNISV